MFASLTREVRFCLDARGRFTYVGGAWYATLGREPDALLGAHWTMAVSLVDHDAMRAAIERARSTRDLQPELALRMSATPGPMRLVDWTIAPGTGADAIVAVGRGRAAQLAEAEATREAARLQHHVEALEAKVRELDEHSHAMERFAAVAAHQMSEPLVVAESGAIMVAEELGDTLDPDLRARLDAIGRGAARARQVIDALLMDARSAAGISLGPVDVGLVVEQVLEEMTPRMTARGVVAEVDALPTVCAEARLLAVVYQNLLSNALKYGPRDGGRIRISADERADGWRLTVTSGGAPLAEHEVTQIFEPFRRVPGERRAPGSGLGLAICARVIRRLRGTIGVEPLADGNAFYFVLPAALDA